MELCKIRTKRKVYNDSCLSQETRKFLNRQSKLALKRTRKRTTKLKIRKREEIIKIRGKLIKHRQNKIENMQLRDDSMKR